MAVDAARAKSLFLIASDLFDAAERVAYLERECGGDAELRDRVEALLRANGAAPPSAGAENATSAHGLDRRPSTADFGDPSASLGSVLVGRYKLIQEIGEGGMGRVYMAQQTEPVKRAVAVKVINAGMDSKSVLARFEAERQALAMMDHPNIAKVLDAGATQFGHPFFVMELVKGTPLTQYCDEHKLSLRQRLELFVPVCQAIQHAHQKGIIHRDIKPSNVLVAMYDDRPVPKVIDFGVAKAAGQSLTDKTLMTGFGAVVGTPEYMSPEQANLNNLDIDTRSDVYSLGVVLYELLTGSTPVDRKSLGKAALLEILRIVREVEAPRPSAKLNTMDTLPGVAANRATEPGKLSKLMKGELDWVLLKALEKDRTRRYETANGLARDIQRYLVDELVEARPPSASYRLHKFAHKNRKLLAIATAFAMLLILGAGGSLWQAIRATRAETRARVNEAIAREKATAEATQRQRAENNERQAKASEAEAKAVLTFFEERVLAAGGPERKATRGLGKDVTLRRAIDVATAEVATAFQDKPLVEASIRNVLGVTYFNLGDYPPATQQLERAVALRQANLGAEHPDTLGSTFHLGEVYLNSGKRDLARPLAEETLRRQRAILGPAHFDTLRSMWLVAMLSKPDEALLLFEESYKLRRATLGSEDPTTLRAMWHLARHYRKLGRFDQGLPLSEEAVRLMQATLGRTDAQTQVAMSDLAQAYLEAGKLDQALPLAEDSFNLMNSTMGTEHLYTRAGMELLVKIYDAARKYDEALRVGQDLLSIRRRMFPADDPRLANILALLGRILLHMQKPADAEPVLRECLAIRQKKEADFWQTFQTQSLLGGSLLNQQKYTEAEPFLLQGYEGLKLSESKIPGNDKGLLTEVLEQLVQLYTAMGKPDDATKWRTELANNRELAQPPQEKK